MRRRARSRRGVYVFTLTPNMRRNVASLLPQPVLVLHIFLLFQNVVGVWLVFVRGLWVLSKGMCVRLPGLLAEG